MAEQCSLDFLNQFKEAFDKETIDAWTMKLVKATEGMSPREREVLATSIIQDMTDIGKAGPADMSLLVDYRNMWGDMYREQQLTTLLHKRANTNASDHIASATSLARTMYEKGEATHKDIAALSKRLPEVDADDIRDALRTSGSAEEFIDTLDEISGKFSKEQYTKNLGYYNGFIEMLEDADSTIQTRERAALGMLENALNASPDLRATFMSDLQFQKSMDDLFANIAEGKFTTELATKLYNDVIKPLTARANEQLHYVRNPLDLLFNAGVADPAVLLATGERTFISTLRDSIIDDPAEALKRMGVPLNTVMKKMGLDVGEYINGSKPIPYEEILQDRLKEIYKRLTQGDQYTPVGAHIDGSDLNAYTELARGEIMSHWNASGGISPIFVVPWKDGNAFRSYLAQYGNAPANAVFVNKLRWLGKNIGITQAFGTRPEFVFKNMLEKAKENANAANDKRSLSLLQGKWLDTVPASVRKPELPADILKKVTELRQKRTQLQVEFSAENLSDAEFNDIHQRMTAIDAELNNIHNDFYAGIEAQLSQLRVEKAAATGKKEVAVLSKQIKDLEAKLASKHVYSEPVDYLKGAVGALRDAYGGNPEHYFDNIIGKASTPLDESMSASVGLFRTVAYVRLLGASIFSVFPDFKTRQSTLAPFDVDGNAITIRSQIAYKTILDFFFGGNGAFLNISRVFTEGGYDMMRHIYEYATGKPFRGPTGAEITANLRDKFTIDRQARKMANEYSIIFSDMANLSRNRMFAAYEGASGFTTNLLDISMEGTGLNTTDNSGRQMTAIIMSRYFAKAATTPFEQLDAVKVNQLKQYGIGKKELAALKPFIKEIDGVQRLIGADLLKKGDDELFMKFTKMFYDIDRIATPVPGAKQQALINQGTRPGTVNGEEARLAGMFKSFASTMTQEVMPYLMRNSEAGPGGAKYVAMTGFMLEAMVYAAIGGVLKSISKGEEPPELTPRYVTDLMLKTGVLGLYGDLALKEYDHYNTFSKSLLGPAPGMIDETLAAVTQEKTRARVAKQLILAGTGSAPIATTLFNQSRRAAEEVFLDY